MLKLVKRFDSHRGKVWSVAWSPKGDRFISVGEDKTAELYRLHTSVNFHMGAGDGPPIAGAVTGADGEAGPSFVKVRTFAQEAHTKSIRDVAWSPCGKYVILGSFDSRVTLWEVKDNGEFRTLSVVEGHESEVKSVSWAASGNFFASCGRDKNVMIWNVLDEGDDIDVECSGVLTSHGQDVKHVVWHPKEDVLASASYDDTIKIHKHDENDGDWSTVATLAGHTSTVWGIDFNAEGNKLVSCSADKTVKIWTMIGKMSDWSCTTTIAGHHSRPIYSISWNKRSGLIATGCGDNHIRVFQEKSAINELATGLYDQIFQIKVGDWDVNNVVWNPMTSDILASASDQYVHVWRWVDELGTY